MLYLNIWQTVDRQMLGAKHITFKSQIGKTRLKMGHKFR